MLQVLGRKADVSVSGTPIQTQSPALANKDGVCTG